jgi:hypothetical protein
MNTMSTQNLIMVYFGSTSRAEALIQLADSEGSYVVHTDDVMATLGQVVVMYPNVIIVDDTLPGAVDVVMHLRSINISNLLILSDAPHLWNIAPETNTVILSSTSSSAAILAAARVLATGELQAA